MNATRARHGQLACRAPAARARRGAASAASDSPLYSIGRVQTPTLAILVRREQEIRAFRPRDYWEVRGTFATAAPAGGAASWRGGPPPGATRSRTASAQPLGARALAERSWSALARTRRPTDPRGPIVERLRAKERARAAAAAVRPDVAAADRQPPFGLSARAHARGGAGALRAPQGPDLSAHRLAPPAERRGGELPKLFAALAQLPELRARSRRRCWPTAARALAARVRRRQGARPPRHHPHRQGGALGRAASRRAAHLRSGRAALPGRVSPRRRVRGHRGRHPRRVRADAGGGAAAGRPGDATRSPDDELLAALPPPPDRFLARGRVRLVAGWQAVARIRRRQGGARDARQAEGAVGDDQARAATARGGTAAGRPLRSRSTKQTRPPPRHTEATLLGRDGVGGPRHRRRRRCAPPCSDTGLGTPATRAATIETLLKRKFIARDGKKLVADGDGHRAHRRAAGSEPGLARADRAPGRRAWRASRAARRRAPRSWPTSRATCAR